jgi:hypothetical protein
LIFRQPAERFLEGFHALDIKEGNLDLVVGRPAMHVGDHVHWKAGQRRDGRADSIKRGLRAL